MGETLILPILPIPSAPWILDFPHLQSPGDHILQFCCDMGPGHDTKYRDRRDMGDQTTVANRGLKKYRTG